jgi:diaminopimelate epimerase
VIPQGREFFKMSGSGNDFVLVDARTEPAGDLDTPATVQAICARATGIGADGLVLLEPSVRADIRMRYLNSDGSYAALCGNASLCTARLFVELGGAAPGAEFTIESESGVLKAKMDPGVDQPEVDLAPVANIRDNAPTGLAPGEQRAGFAEVGVPHLVVLCDNVDAVDVVGRGRPLRNGPAFLPDGTNVDFVDRDAAGRWRMRTYERGVEGETLACGTGAVASALLLGRWGLAQGPTAILTRSGKDLRIRTRSEPSGLVPTLTGEARIVFAGRFGEI